MEECQFFYKIGSCRHGNKCIRKHTNVKDSPVLILDNILLSSTNLQEEVKDIFIEVALIAPIWNMLVAGNQSPHIRGTIYIEFQNESDAQKAYQVLNKRWFAKKPIFAKFLPSQLLTTVLCRDGDRCTRKDECNYVHMARIPQDFWRELFTSQLASTLQQQEKQEQLEQ